MIVMILSTITRTIKANYPSSWVQQGNQNVWNVRRCQASWRDLLKRNRFLPYDPPLKSSEQAKYLMRYTEHQIAEIVSIRDFLTRRLRGLCTQIEEEAVKVLAPEALTFEREGDTESAQWDSEFYLLTESGKHEQVDHLEYLMSLGLPYIRRVIESNGREQISLFLKYSNHNVIKHLIGSKFITKAIENLSASSAGSVSVPEE